MPAATDADVVIVGAGPAGLACASALAGSSVLLLEREDRHGGRVHTIDLAHQRVDLGACFAFDPAVVPARLTVHAGRMVQERMALGVCDGGRVHSGATPLGCLARMGIDGETRDRIESFAHTESDAASLRGTRAYALLDALLHQVHPGELADYDAGHQRDGLFTWYPDHWELGNRTLTDALLARSGAQLQLDTEVTKIVERPERVEVEYRSGGRSGRVSCRAAVIATTADAAASMVDWPDPDLRRFLAAARYASYFVVALAGPATPALAAFRSLVPTAGSPAVVMQQRTFERDRAVLLCYYRGTDFDAFASRPDAELVAMSRSRLAALGIAGSALGLLGESAVRRWANAGTVLSSAYLQSRAAAAERGGKSIFLAGDYACAEGGVGYGIADAVSSGIDAARRVRGVLAR